MNKTHLCILSQKVQELRGELSAREHEIVGTEVQISYAKKQNDGALQMLFTVGVITVFKVYIYPLRHYGTKRDQK